MAELVLTNPALSEAMNIAGAGFFKTAEGAACDLNSLLKLSSEAMWFQGMHPGADFPKSLAAAAAAVSGTGLPTPSGIKLEVRTHDGRQMNVML